MNVAIFDSVSIRGRYLYGYCCLLNVIKQLGISPIYKPLDLALRNFIENDRLDYWEDVIVEFMPSDVLDLDFPLTQSVVLPANNSSELISYYAAQPIIILNIIEQLVWLGISNLYGAFDSKWTLSQILEIVKYVKENDIAFPDEMLLTMFPVSEDGGWGYMRKIEPILSNYSYT